MVDCEISAIKEILRPLLPNFDLESLEHSLSRAYPPSKLELEIDCIDTKEKTIKSIRKVLGEDKYTLEILGDIDYELLIREAELPEDFFSKDSYEKDKVVKLKYSENPSRNFFYALFCHTYFIDEYIEYFIIGWAYHAFQAGLDVAGKFLCDIFMGGVNGWGLQEMLYVAAKFDYNFLYANIAVSGNNHEPEEFVRWLLIEGFSIIIKHIECGLSGENLKSLRHIVHRMYFTDSIDHPFKNEYSNFLKKLLENFILIDPELCISAVNVSLGVADKDILKLLEKIDEKYYSRLNPMVNATLTLKLLEIDDMTIHNKYITKEICYEEALSDLLHDITIYKEESDDSCDSVGFEFQISSDED